MILAAARCNKPITNDQERFRPSNSEVGALLADSARLGKATGWTAKVDLMDGLKRSVAWWQDRFCRGRVRRDRTFML